MRTHPSTPAPGRRGYLYVAVMMTAAIVSVIGFSAIGIARIGLRKTEAANDGASAKACARSAVEDAVRQVNADANWRTTYTHDTEYPSPAHDMPGGGSFTWKLVDDDGNLTDDPTDSVWVHGIGRKGDAVFVEKVQLQAAGPGLTCLEASLCVNGDITLASTIDFVTNQFVSSNGNVNATAWQASIDGSAQAGGTCNGTITGNSTNGITPRVLPGSSVFDYYLSNGTWINVHDLDYQGGNKHVRQVVLNPNLNPYGSGETNAEGIYVIDAEGWTLEIHDCRIGGTLVLLNLGAGSTIRDQVHWDRAVANYPALLVNGSIEISTTNVFLQETWFSKTFNPIGAPYQGVEDTDFLDQYPSRIKGIVYVSGTLHLKNWSIKVFDGTVVAGSVICDGEADLTYRNTYLNYPPPGFRDGTAMAIAPGTWQRDVLTP